MSTIDTFGDLARRLGEVACTLAEAEAEIEHLRAALARETATKEALIREAACVVLLRFDRYLVGPSEALARLEAEVVAAGFPLDEAREMLRKLDAEGREA